MAGKRVRVNGPNNSLQSCNQSYFRTHLMVSDMKLIIFAVYIFTLLVYVYGSKSGPDSVLRNSSVNATRTRTKILKSSERSNIDHPNYPTVHSKCHNGDLVVQVKFKNMFTGTVFVQGYFGYPNCSSPNMPPVKTYKMTFQIPLLSCGNKIRMKRNYTQVRNTMIVQYFSMLETEMDLKTNVTCRIYEPLAKEFWTSYVQRSPRPKPTFVSWIDFQLGEETFREEAEMFGVKNKLFIVIYVKDRNKNRSFLIRKCIAHDDLVVQRKTTVVNLSEYNSCSGDVMDELELIPDPSISDLIGFVQINEIEFSRKETYYISCGFDMCPVICPRICPGSEESLYTPVQTYKITKPLDEILNQDSDISKRIRFKNLKQS